MAYVLTTQKILDTRKRVVIKLVGSGNADDPGNVAVNVSSLGGYTTQGPAVTIKGITYDVNSPGSGYVRLYWFGSANSNIAMLSKAGVMPIVGSDGITLLNNATNPTGDIWISTTGFAGSNNASFTIILDMHKVAPYFNPGYDLDPIAFNKGVAAPNGQNVN